MWRESQPQPCCAALVDVGDGGGEGGGLGELDLYRSPLVLSSPSLAVKWGDTERLKAAWA